MPPRYAYWTILIDQKPTAFRAREREELLPTFNQLRRKSADVVMKWFARGRLWESPEEAQTARRAPKAQTEKRASTWRPGGQHRDPRERFKKRSTPHGTGPPVGRMDNLRRERPKFEPPRDNRKFLSTRGGGNQRKPWRTDRDPQRGSRAGDPGRREGEAPPKRDKESPTSPPPAEQIATKPKPPERG